MMNRALPMLMAAVLGFVVCIPFAGVTVAAHEHVTVGEYELIVGWRDEPAVAGVLNGLDLGIEHHLSNGTTVLVVGQAGNLTAVLSYGSASVTKAIEAQFGRPGWYTFDVIPTRAGPYSVHLNGTIEGIPVNVDVPLDDVSPASDLAFPVADPTESELKARIDAANAQITALQAQLTAALAIAIIGLIVAVTGLAAGWRMSRTRRKSP